MGTDLLFVEPSASRGAARVVDFWGSLTRYNISSSPQAADSLALYSDFCQTGQDISVALEQAAAQSSAGQLCLFGDK